MGRFVILVAVGLLLVASAAAFRTSRHAPQSPPAPVTLFSAMKYKEAAEAAKGKLLLVDATATWCGPCQKMERDTWPDADLTAWIKANGIAVQLDVDQEPDVASELAVTGMPTIILIRDGRELGRLEGYTKPKELLDWLQTKAR